MAKIKFRITKNKANNQVHFTPRKKDLSTTFKDRLDNGSKFLEIEEEDLFLD